MKEQDLIELGFTKEYVTSAESGGDPFYFFAWEPYPLSNFSLVSQPNDEVENDNWKVNIFGDERNVVFTNKEDIANLIKIIDSNKLV